MGTLVLGVSAFAANAHGQPASAVIVAPVRMEAAEIGRPLVATLDAVTRTTVAAEQEGRVAARTFDDGQLVAEGQPLAELDTELLRIELAAAQASVSAAEADVNRSNVALANSQREYDRQQQLFQQNAAPQKEFLDASMDRDMADADVKLKAAEVVRRKAEITRLEAVIRKSAVKAPFASFVARRSVEVGQWVKQGDPIAELVQIDPLYVTVNVPEAMVVQLDENTTAKVTLDALPGKTLHATLKQVMPEADWSSRTVRVRLQIENDDLKLRPGFFGRAVLTSSQKAGLVVPKDALVTSNEGTIVYAVRDGAAVLIPVRVTAYSGDDALIEPLGPPLSEKDVVVTQGNEQLYPGAAVQVMGGVPGGPPPGGAPQGGPPQGGPPQGGPPDAPPASQP